jgi:DNA-binding XRE family transcriptional regulator
MELYEILRRERRLRDINQDQLAKQLGISHVTLCNIEKGKRCANLRTIQKICDALGYEIVLTKKQDENEKNHN